MECLQGSLQVIFEKWQEVGMKTFFSWTRLARLQQTLAEIAPKGSMKEGGERAQKVHQ